MAAAKRLIPLEAFRKPRHRQPNLSTPIRRLVSSACPDHTGRALGRRPCGVWDGVRTGTGTRGLLVRPGTAARRPPVGSFCRLSPNRAAYRRLPENELRGAPSVLLISDLAPTDIRARPERSAPPPQPSWLFSMRRRRRASFETRLCRASG